MIRIFYLLSILFIIPALWLYQKPPKDTLKAFNNFENKHQKCMK